MRYGKTHVLVCENEIELGRKAASDVADKIRDLLEKKEIIRIVFAAGESQMTFLDALALETGIDWKRVVCCNMDDFYDPKIPEKYTCGYQTKTQLYDRVQPLRAHLVKYNAPDPYREAERFEAVIREEGEFDILCQGIGTSGHLALNEPYDTDFEEQAAVKVVSLSDQSILQLRDDPNFKALGYIPARGITMTIPFLMSIKNIYTMVPLALKRPIIEKLFALDAPATELPASILLQAGGTLYLDKNSCPDHLIHNK